MRKRIISAVLCLAMLLSLVPTAFATNANGYTDVNTEDWYYPAAEYMATNGYMTGYSATTFGPSDTLSRAMFVTILYRVSGEKVSANGTKFEDVPQNTWYSEAVSWAVANGITSGTSATTFSPNAPVTREQMATFMKRYMDAKGIKMSNASIVDNPSDMGTTSAWAKDAVQVAYNFGILLKSDGKVNPRCNATRTDAVVAFYNFLYSCGKVYNGKLLLPSHEHNWVIASGIGHYEQVQVGTEQVIVRYETRQYSKCNGCGALAYTNEEMYGHYDPESPYFSSKCAFSTNLIYTEQVPIYEEQPKYETRWVEDTPTTTVCSICGKQQ